MAHPYHSKGIDCTRCDEARRRLNEYNAQYRDHPRGCDCPHHERARAASRARGKNPGVGSGKYDRDFGTGLCPCGATFTKRAANQSWCPSCRKRKRGSKTSAGSGYTPEQRRAHRALRKHYQQRMNQGERFACWRCGNPINPQRWDLGHDDHDRSIYRGPECVSCNRSTYKREAKRLIL